MEQVGQVINDVYWLEEVIEYQPIPACPHRWETRPLFTSHYQVCTLCGETK